MDKYCGSFIMAPGQRLTGIVGKECGANDKKARDRTNAAIALRDDGRITGLRSWTSRASSFGSVVMMTKLCRSVPSGFFQCSQRRANANGPSDKDSIERSAPWIRQKH